MEAPGDEPGLLRSREDGGCLRRCGEILLATLCEGYGADEWRSHGSGHKRHRAGVVGTPQALQPLLVGQRTARIGGEFEEERLLGGS